MNCPRPVLASFVKVVAVGPSPVHSTNAACALYAYTRNNYVAEAPQGAPVTLAGKSFPALLRLVLLLPVPLLSVLLLLLLLLHAVATGGACMSDESAAAGLVSVPTPALTGCACMTDDSAAAGLVSVPTPALTEDVPAPAPMQQAVNFTPAPAPVVTPVPAPQEHAPGTCNLCTEHTATHSLQDWRCWVHSMCCT